MLFEEWRLWSKIFFGPLSCGASMYFRLHIFCLIAGQYTLLSISHYRNKNMFKWVIAWTEMMQMTGYNNEALQHYELKNFTKWIFCLKIWTVTYNTGNSLFCTIVTSPVWSHWANYFSRFIFIYYWYHLLILYILLLHIFII